MKTKDESFNSRESRWQHVAKSENVGLMTRFRARIAAECQADRGDDFSTRQSYARKLPHLTT